LVLIILVQSYDARFDLKESQRNPSKDLERRMKERAEWAQRREEQQRRRIDAIRQRRQEEILRAQEIDRITQMANEMLNTLNDEIPGWLERKQRVEQAS
jgi:membrane-bound ClpP family serine protease